MVSTPEEINVPRRRDAEEAFKHWIGLQGGTRRVVNDRAALNITTRSASPRILGILLDNNRTGTAGG
jgi:hypothetical protein